MHFIRSFFIIYLAFAGLCSFSFSQDEDSTVPINHDPLEMVRYYENELQTTKLSANDLVPYLQKLARDFYNLSFEHFNFNELTKKQWEETLQRLWNIKKLLHEKLASAHRSHYYNPDNALDEVAGTFRFTLKVIRHLQDYFAQNYERRSPDITTGQRYLRVFGGADWYTQRDRKSGPEYFGAKDLKSGDVILTMSNSSVSGLISRIGAYDTDFSHAALVYRNPQTKQILIVEAVIERGVQVITWEQFAIKRAKKSRISVLRPKGVDEEKLHTAVTNFLGKAALRQHKGNPIAYDFTMTPGDWLTEIQEKKVSARKINEFFCSKVIKKVISDASDGKIDLPTFTSRPQRGTQELFYGMGVRSSYLVAPGDFEIDPYMEPIAEWTNVHGIEKTRRMSIVMRQFFHWMEKGGYRLKMSVKPNGEVETQVGKVDPIMGLKIALLKFLWRQRKLENYRIGTKNFNVTLPNPIRALVKNQFPDYIPQGALMTILFVNQVATEISNLVENIKVQQHGKDAMLTPKQLIELTNTAILSDASVYKDNVRKGRKSSVFHHLFACEDGLL